MAKLKGQSAMEYLMTYGWAILIVIIVVAVLFSLGVFNPSTYTQTTATGFSGFNVPTGSWQLTDSGTMTLQVNNAMGSNIRIIGFNVTQGATRVENVTNGATGLAMSPGETLDLRVVGLPGGTSGSSYSLAVTIRYDNTDTGLTGFRSTGTLVGSIS